MVIPIGSEYDSHFLLTLRSLADGLVLEYYGLWQQSLSPNYLRQHRQRPR